MAVDKQQQFMKMYTPVHDGFVRFCEARCYNVLPAQDLVQDTLLIAFDKFDSIREPIAFKSFLFTIARRLVKDKARRSKFKGELKEQDRLNLAADNDPSVRHDVALLHRCLDKLPEKQAEALTLFELSGFSLKEIQAIQGGSLSAVKLRLKRGRERLRALLVKDPVEVPVKHAAASLVTVCL